MYTRLEFILWKNQNIECITKKEKFSEYCKLYLDASLLENLIFQLRSPKLVIQGLLPLYTNILVPKEKKDEKYIFRLQTNSNI